MTAADKDHENYSSIIAAIRTGDKSAYKELFQIFSTPLLDYSMSIVKDYQDSKDIVQEVFISVWQKKEDLGPGFQIKPYLYKSVRNNSLKAAMNKRPAMESSSQFLEQIPDSLMPNDEVEEKELYSAFKIAMDELPERCREIYNLNRYKSLSYSEIAAVLNISINTVKTQMGRALGLLKVRLADYL